MAAVPTGYVNSLPAAGAGAGAGAGTAIATAATAADEPIFYSPSADGSAIIKTKENRYVLPDGTSFLEYTKRKDW